MKKMKYFWGYELEGKYKRVPTLFIAGSGNLNEIEKRIKYCYNNNLPINHLYFGAYWQTEIKNWDIIQEVVKNYNYLFTIEVTIDKWNTIPQDIIDNESIHIMVTYKAKNINKDNLTIKIENENDILCYNNPISNSYDDYAKDIDLTNIKE